jgi:hypothetical protein
VSASTELKAAGYTADEDSRDTTPPDRSVEPALT